VTKLTVKEIENLAMDRERLSETEASLSIESENRKKTEELVVSKIRDLEAIEVAEKEHVKEVKEMIFEQSKTVSKIEAKHLSLINEGKKTTNIFTNLQRLEFELKRRHDIGVLCKNCIKKKTIMFVLTNDSVAGSISLKKRKRNSRRKLWL
jgi:ATPase subunit of ABC transporter with duplicated ATPase domains